MPEQLGKPVLRKEDPALLSGRGRYADDLPIPVGTLHAHVIRSPHAHAGIVRIDAADDRMGMGRADHMGMQRAARLRQIVGIAAAPRQQCRVFLARERHTERGHQSTVKTAFA